MDKPDPSRQPTNLPDYQKLVARLVVERGFDAETTHQVFSLLVEEVGELAKAMRKTSGMKVDKTSKDHQVEDEAADVLWLLLDLCNRLDIDLAKAFEAKEHKNQARIWAAHET